MIAIQCTQKILKEIGQEYTGPIIPTVPLGDWHANLLLLDRRKCVLFTNDLTRYSFLVAGLKKPHFKMLDEIFRQNLFKCLLRDGFRQEAIEKVLDEIREVVFTRTSDRSVLGTMNDMAQILKWTIQDKVGLEYVDLGELMDKVNRMPLKPLDYEFSFERMRKALKSES